VAVGWGARGGGGAGGAGSTASVGWADVSHLAKLELQGPSEAIDAAAGTELPFSTAVRRDDAWWCRPTQTRALVIGKRPDLSGSAEGLDVLDVTCNFAALTLVGPLARETFARFCALDLRPQVTPVNALRPGSIGRQPGIVIRESEERYLFLFGWATGEYMWSVVADAGEHLGGGPVGADALREVSAAHA
jgi:glycine cleavage system aminomethyltransferase T